MSHADSDRFESALGERLFEVAPGVYRISLPTDFPVGDVNVYFVDGPEPVLIDTGVRGERSLSVLAGALKKTDRRLDQIRSVLLTHVHVDHAGSANAIRRATGARVYLHPHAHHRLVDVEASHQSGIEWYRQFMVQSGFSDAMIERYMAASGIFLEYAESCPELLPVVTGDEIIVGEGRRLVAHETFGHTAHHVAFVLEPDRILFSGDHLLPHITSNPTLEAPAGPGEDKPRPLLLYRESLARLARTSVVKACPGHARPFANVAERCGELLTHQQQRCEQLLDVVIEEGTVTRKELSLALFGKVPLWEIYLTLSEVQAAVEVLQADGKVRVHSSAGVTHIEPA